MPIYEYISVNANDQEQSCRICAKGFELRRPVDRAPLEVCPLCKNPVKKVISSVNTPKITKPLSYSDAKKAGFTVLEKRDEGVYEKQ
ncbi:MAG: FmdB family zinc ribbon protein [Akkermansiaceae bacterium]